MEAVRKILQVKNNTLVLQGLDALNNKIVEVTVLPLSITRGRQDMDAVERFCGIFQDGSSLTEALLEERKKDIEIEEKIIAR